MKPRKFETSEDFQRAIQQELLPTLQAYGMRFTNITFPHNDICQIQAQSGNNPFEQDVYSIWRKVKVNCDEEGLECFESGELEWCKAVITKQEGKNIN